VRIVRYFSRKISKLDESLMAKNSLWMSLFCDAVVTTPLSHFQHYLSNRLLVGEVC